MRMGGDGLWKGEMEGMTDVEERVGILISIEFNVHCHIECWVNLSFVVKISCFVLYFMFHIRMF